MKSCTVPRFNEVRGSGRALKRCLPLWSHRCPWHTLLQAPPQGGQGQHRQVQLASSCCLVRSESSMRAWTVSSSCSDPHTGGAAAPWSSPCLRSMAPALSVGSTAWAATPSLASLDAIEADSATLNGGGRVRKPPASPRRKPTPRQRVRWKASGPLQNRLNTVRSTPKPRARP